MAMNPDRAGWRQIDIQEITNWQWNLQIDLSKIRQTLEVLADIRSVLKRDENGYSFAVPKFLDVIPIERDLQDLLQEKVEKYQQGDN